MGIFDVYVNGGGAAGAQQRFSALTMNQGTFSDYHRGKLEEVDFDGPIVLVGYGCSPGNSYPYRLNASGIFFDQGWTSDQHPIVGSRLSWFSTLTTCKIIIMLQLLQLCMVWLMSMVAILIRIL